MQSCHWVLRKWGELVKTTPRLLREWPSHEKFRKLGLLSFLLRPSHRPWDFGMLSLAPVAFLLRKSFAKRSDGLVAGYVKDGVIGVLLQLGLVSVCVDASDVIILSYVAGEYLSRHDVEDH